MTPKLPWRVRKRCHAMLWAYLHYSMRRCDEEWREECSWRHLLEWARLGGTRDEAPK